MKESRRVYITLDAKTYGELETIRKENKFKTLPKLVCSIIHAYMGLKGMGEKTWNIPEDEEEWLRRMFSELADVESQKPGYHRAGPHNEYAR